MISPRARLITAATVVGLGGLAGVALGSNQGPSVAPAPSTVTSSRPASSPAPVLTSASGSVSSIPVSRVVSAPAGRVRRHPVVTRSSGAGRAGGENEEMDD